VIAAFEFDAVAPLFRQASVFPRVAAASREGINWRAIGKRPPVETNFQPSASVI